MGFEYFYEHNEANFGAPLQKEVSGGTHLTFEVVLHQGGVLHALRRPGGMHDGPKNALYFPHGLIRFGEAVADCVSRLSREQAGVDVEGVDLYTLPSWVDDDDHWHLCLNVLATPTAPLRPPQEVSEVVPIDRRAIPADWGWWTVEQIDSIFTYLDSKAA